MPDFEPKPSAAVERIRAALDAAGCAVAIPPDTGPVVRALAASKRAATFLCIGDGAGEIGAWILDGMDHSSGMVALVQDECEAAVLESELDRDVRASVHLQDPASFLSDVHGHRFDLIVDLTADARPEILRAALGVLGVGGVYLATQPGTHALEALAGFGRDREEGRSSDEPSDFELARWGNPPRSLIIVRRTERIRKRRRPRSRGRVGT